MRPATLYANLLVSAEALLRMLGFALATGIIFARFSRPAARIMFSAFAVVTRLDGKPTFMFRVSTECAIRILDTHVTLTLARNEATQEGVNKRRFHDLKVARSYAPLFVMSRSVLHAIEALHTIDESSPLHGATPDSLASEEAQIVATIVGIDDTLSHTIHARFAYGASDILFGRRLADILTGGKGPTPVVDYSRFQDTVR